jgi:rRNA large subunit m3Psi methyltransferase RlmH
VLRVTSFGKLKSSLRDRYLHRLNDLVPFRWNEIEIRQMPSLRVPQLLPEEARFLKDNQEFVLLDVQGRPLSSKEFQNFCFQKSDRHFVIGPAIGFHPDFHVKAEAVLSLSRLTLTHELAQIVLIESVYRAVCAEKNHPFAK